MNVLLFAIESPTIIILVVAAIFLLFGGSKLPQLAKALGQSKKAFKEGIDEADGKSDRSKLDSVDDEALFEEARRRAQQMRADETKKIDSFALVLFSWSALGAVNALPHGRATAPKDAMASRYCTRLLFPTTSV